jgi:hypothetical protein
MNISYVLLCIFIALKNVFNVSTLIIRLQNPERVFSVDGPQGLFSFYFIIWGQDDFLKENVSSL